jgi:type IV pilus assembly protein PilQ
MITRMAAGAIGGLVLATALAFGSGSGAGDGEARVSLDVKEAPVTGVVRVLAEAGGFQVVFDSGISCQLTMKLPSARWRQALAAALAACDLGHEEEGDILRVATVARLREEAAARRRLDEERRLTAAGRLASFRLSYARAQELAPLLERILSPSGHVSYDPRTGTLLVAY